MTRYLCIVIVALAMMTGMVAGCSSGGDDGNQPTTQECYISLDCSPGYYCQLPEGICVSSLPTDGDASDPDPVDTDDAIDTTDTADGDDIADGDDDPTEQDSPAEEEQDLPTETDTTDTPTCRDDVKEDNDTRAQSATLPLNATVALLVSADNDYYSFQACADGQLTITAVFKHAEGDINLALFNDGGAALARSETDTDNEQITLTTTADEPLYVAVYNATPEPCTPYSLTINLINCGGNADGDIDTPDTDPDPVDTDPEIDNAPDLCDPDPCNGHGTCNPANGSCSCNDGYGGDTCNQCAAGYVGYPNCAPQTTAPSAAGDIIITEIMYDPHFALIDDTAEWFELHNPGNLAMNLAGCIVKENLDDSTTIAEMIIPPGGYALLCRSDNSNLNGGLTPDYVFEFALSNSTSGETLTLTCNSIVIDEVNYDSGPDFPDEPAHSISLDPSAYDVYDNDDGANWCLGQDSYYTGATSPDEDNFGTPGAANPTCPTQ